MFANNCDECGKVIGIDSKVNVEDEDDKEIIFNVPGPLHHSLFLPTSVTGAPHITLHTSAFH